MGPAKASLEASCRALAAELVSATLYVSDANAPIQVG